MNKLVDKFIRETLKSIDWEETQLDLDYWKYFRSQKDYNNILNWKLRRVLICS